MKVAIYARVSTDSENQLNSLKNQQVYYSNYCRERGYSQYDIYADEGLTGTNMKRGAFLTMLHDAGLNVVKDEISTRFVVSDREPKFEYIITKDVSRFARNTNVIEVIDLLREKGVYIYFQNADIDTKKDNYHFLLNMFLNFAQQESIDRSQKVKFGLRQRAMNGDIHFGSERLYGYGYDKEKKEIFLVEHEAEIVKKVFHYYTVDSLGSKQIADILNSKGYVTQNNKKWTANGIVRMLKNEKYTGNANLLKYSYGMVNKENRRKLIKEQAEWIKKEEVLPKIIETDLFLDAQTIMESRTSKDRGVNTPKNIFSKKVKCGKCGKNFIRSNQKQNDQTYFFYACSNRRRTGECDNKSITLKRLEEIMKPYCEGKFYEILTERKDTINRLIDTNIVALEISSKFAESKKEEIQNKITQIQNEIDELINSFLNSSEIVRKAVERKIEEKEQERSNLELELINTDQVTINEKIRKLKETKNTIQKSALQKTFNIDELMEFVDEIKVIDDEVTVNFAFDNLLPKTTTVKGLFKESVTELMAFADNMKTAIIKS